MRRSAVVIALIVSGAQPVAAAGATDRFVAWLGAHPDVQFAMVSSEAGPLEPYTTRFRVGPKSKVPPGARVRIVDARGALVCLVRPPAQVCVRATATAHMWSADRSRVGVHRWEEVVLLGPLPDGRVDVYSLRLPEATVRKGAAMRMNPKWVDPPHPGPWWALEYEVPVLGDAHAALEKASPVTPTTDVPEWLDDATGFSAFVTGDPKVFRLQTATDVGLCVRAPAGWVCRPIPQVSLDEIHPGLPRTYPGLPPQLPVIYGAQAAFPGDWVSVAIERSWIRSKNAHTPSLDWAGAFVEIVEWRPGETAFAHRATMELTSGRLTDLLPSHSGFPAVDSLSLSPTRQAPCINVVAAGTIPPKMRTVPLGRYCVTADGHLVP